MSSFATGATVGVVFTTGIWAFATLLGIALRFERCAGCSRCPK